MRLSDYRAIVFDLDDTLYLERDYVRSGFKAVGKWLQQKRKWSEDAVQEFVRLCLQLFQAGRRGDILDAALSQIVGAPQTSLVGELVEVYRHHAPRIDLQSDARCLLDELRAHPNIWIITDGAVASQSAKVRALNLQTRVREVIYTDLWGRRFWKPHRRAFDRVQRLTGALSTECVYIADNPSKDFLAPRRLGWTTWRIRRSEGLHAEEAPLAGAAPDVEFESLWPLCSSNTFNAAVRHAA
jgi:putative hydrolase of the HAD superfamily